jgi:hypothetical protein
MARAVYLCTDLLFTSKIREVAKQVGVEIAGARDAAQLAGAAADAALAIIDLRRPDALAAIDALPRELAKVGFIDHERVDVMEAARERGVRAFAKGQFAKELPMLLAAL